MQERPESIPEEVHVDYQPLIHNLRHLYSTPDEDAQSLARMHQHLLYSPESLIHSQTGQARKTSRALKTHSERSAVMNNTEIHTGERRSWSHSFNMIAAVILMTLLIGSMVLIFTYVRQGGTGSGGGPAVPTPTPNASICELPTPTPVPTGYPTPVSSISTHLKCLTPTPFPTITPTPAPVTPTPTPTDVATPTPTPISIATPTPAPPGVVTPTPNPTGVPTPTPTPTPNP